MVRPCSDRPPSENAMARDTAVPLGPCVLTGTGTGRRATSSTCHRARCESAGALHRDVDGWAQWLWLLASSPASMPPSRVAFRQFCALPFALPLIAVPSSVICSSYSPNLPQLMYTVGVGEASSRSLRASHGGRARYGVGAAREAEHGCRTGRESPSEHAWRASACVYVCAHAAAAAAAAAADVCVPPTSSASAPGNRRTRSGCSCLP